ncbi:MAG: hypothetical protein QUS33_07205 [Dehalococcoidia bacterium]|nr:hypothetical protein [Dehalococcoidia bacterium]
MFDESPQRYTKRLFLYATDEIAELLRQKYKVANYLTDDYEYMSQMAWLTGASSAAQALIREVDVVKSAWGRGDDQKTLMLIKLCVPHMISVWLSGIDQQPQMAEDARRAQYGSAASSMFGIINRFLSPKPSSDSALTSQDVNDAIDMDALWMAQSGNEGARSVYGCLILSKALEACGQRCIEWSRVTFPIESVQRLLDVGVLLDASLVGDSQRLLRVMDCLEQGVRPVRRYYVMNMEGKVHRSGRS